MTCAEARERLMDLLCGLPTPEGLESHLAQCPSCAAELDRLRRQESLLTEHFSALRRPPMRLPSFPQRRRAWRPLAAAAAVLLAFTATWRMRPGGDGGPPPAYGDIQVLKRGYAVTVFNQGIGLVRDHRRILNLRPGVNRFRLDDIPSGLISDSVRFRSDTDPAGCKVLEQNFEYDLAGREALLSKYVDREIPFERTDPKTLERTRLRGTLLSTEGLVRMEGGEVRAAFPGEPVLPELPGGLITRPALAWVLDAPKESRHETTVSYLTDGMSWKADYILTLRDGKRLDLDGWASVTNESGATYADATLKLLAGDAHLEKPGNAPPGAPLQAWTKALGDDQGFQEKTFGEYHLYTLQRPTTLKDRETKQIDLLGAKGIPYRTEYVFERSANPCVLSFLVFRNDKASSLGMPLPAGDVRILASGTDGEAEQVALASIEHTPKDEEIRIPRGAALALAAERVVAARRWRGHDVEIRLRNHGDEAVRVKVLEHPEGGWTIPESSHPFTRPDARTAAFEVDVPADKETLIRYTVKEEQP